MTQSRPIGPTQTTSEARGTRSAPEPSDLARGDCAAERRGRGRSDFGPRMCGAWRGAERAHGAEPPPPSGAEPKQRGGITPPAGQRAKRAEGRGAGGRGQGTTHRQTDSGRSAPSRSDSRNIYPPRPSRAASMAARREQARRRARRAGAPRPDKMPPLCCAWIGDEDARRSRLPAPAVAASAVTQGRSEAEPAGYRGASVASPEGYPLVDQKERTSAELITLRQKP